MRTRTSICAALVAVALLAAACNNGSSATSGGGGSSSSSASPTPSPSKSAGGMGGYGYGGAGYGSGGKAGGGGGGGGNSVLTVDQSNYLFSPSAVTVKSGDTITVNDTNPTTSHTFTVTGEGIDVVNDGGQSQDVKIDLQPGTYEFICRYHESSGMTGTLVVT